MEEIKNGSNKPVNSLSVKERIDLPLAGVSVAILFAFVALMAIRPQQTLEGVSNVFWTVIG